MAGNLKGIVIEIGGNTVGLEKSLKDVNSKSRDLQSELSQVQKLLKFNPRNTTLMAQQQRLLTDQVENTSKKLNQLKQAEAQVQIQFQRGEISADVYRAFQRELITTEKSLQTAKKAVSDLKEEEDNLKKATKELDRLFEATGKSIDDFGDVLGSKLINSIKNGTASSKDMKRAFDLVGKAAIGADGDLDKLRQSINKLDTGEASIRKVRKELKKLTEDAKESEKATDGLGEKLGGLAGGIAAGVGIGSTIEKALDVSNLDTQIGISFDVPKESLQSIKDITYTIQNYGIEGEAALNGVRRQWALNGDASDEENAKIVQYAGTVSKAFSEIDFTELIQESKEISSMLGMTQEEALGMVNTLLKTGFPPEQLDVIAEYGSQLKLAGFNASEVQSIISSAVSTDSWNIDNLLDGLQEGRFLIGEFGRGIDDTTADLLEGTGISAEQLKKWGQAVNEGGEKGKTAFLEVAQAVADIDNKTKQNEIGVALYGTMWETQSTKITDSLLNASNHMVTAKQNQDGLKSSVEAIDSSPQTQLNTALSDMTKELTPLLTQVAEFIGKVATWASENPKLVSTILSVVTGLGIFLGIIMALIPIVLTIASVAGAMGVAIGAVASPVLIVIGVIAAIIAIGIALWKNWATIQTKATALSKLLGGKFKEMVTSVKAKFGELPGKISEIWGKVVKFFKDIDLKQIGKDIIEGLIKGISSKVSDVAKAAKNIANGVGDKIKSILKLGSPSRLLKGMGQDTGDGFAIGLKDSLGKIKTMSEKVANAAIPNMREPQNALGGSTSPNNSLVVNLHSPKALDVREANRQFSKNLSKMSLLW